MENTKSLELRFRVLLASDGAKEVRFSAVGQQGAEAQLKLDGALGMTCPPRSPQLWELMSVTGGMGNSWMNADPASIARAD